MRLGGTTASRPWLSSELQTCFANLSRQTSSSRSLKHQASLTREISDSYLRPVLSLMVVLFSLARSSCPAR